MSFDALYPEQTQQALNARVQRPELNASRWQGGAFTGFMDAFTAAAPAAILESTRVLSPILDAYGKTMAYRNGARQEDSIDQIGTNDMGQMLRQEIERIAPDPQTTGTAAQVVYGAGKLIGKAVGYGMIGGTAGAVIGTGLDEGVNETMRLQDKGVGLRTASQAGVVHGAMTAASIAMPIAGKTLTQTAGLALAGGPASFMAENALIGTLLEKADFQQIAREYDPFDPVGLTVSTLAPLLFGAGAHVLRAKAKPQVDTPPALNPDTEAAARTLLNARNVEQASLAPRDDFAARNAHADALQTAARSLDAGQPVNLELDLLPLDLEKAGPALAKLQDAAEAIEARAIHHAGWAEAEAAQPGQRARGADAYPEGEHARRIVAERPDMGIYSGATDEQGRPVVSRADDLWAEAEADWNQSRGLDRRAFEAAVNCFLRHPA